MKPTQLWFQVWRRVQKQFDPHPACGTDELPELTFLNTTVSPKGWNDTSLELLWRYNLHYFDGLREGVEIVGGEQWEDFISRWIAENPRGSFPGWEPYPTSLRIVNWVKWIESGARGLEIVVRTKESLAEQVDWLAGHLEYHILANHYLANLKAMVIGSAALGRDYGKWMTRYRKQIDEQILSDGGHYERSVMYHAIILEDVLDVIRFFGSSADWLRPVAERMLGYLTAMTGPDGAISKFNDSTDGIAKSPGRLFAYAKELGISHDQQSALGESGFIRQTAGDYVVVAKCGEIGPSYQPGHAHADTFTFELWRNRVKVIGDTGCSTYIPGPVRSYERSTAAHNTVVIDGCNSSEVWAAHRVGRRFDYGNHRRTFQLTGYGLSAVDELMGTGEHEVDVRFHLPPGVPLNAVSIECPGERVVDDCNFAVGWNRREKGICVSFRQRVSFPMQIQWTIK